MTDAARLYAAVLAAPNDLDLRLDYADAIDGSDTEHAELIRVQIGAARRERVRLRTFATRTDDTVDDYWRATTLVRRIGDRLGAPIAGLVRTFSFACGFPEVVYLSGSAFLENAPTLYSRAPVRHVRFRDVDAALIARLATSPLLDRLVSISLRDCPIGTEGLRALAASEHLRGLRLLDLTNCGIGTAGAEALAEAAGVRLPQLQWLGFDRNVPFVPYGEGTDAVSGRQPVDVHVPELGVRLDERYGPFPWMRVEWAEHGRPSYGGV